MDALRRAYGDSSADSSNDDTDDGGDVDTNGRAGVVVSSVKGNEASGESAQQKAVVKHPKQERKISLSTKIPLPASFASAFGVSAVESKHTDNPAAHQRRIRTFEHVEGNWPVSVYLRLGGAAQPDKSDASAGYSHPPNCSAALTPPSTATLESLQEEAMGAVNSAYPAMSFQAMALGDLHLSLSRTATLKYQEIEPFFAILGREIDAWKRPRDVAAGAAAEPALGGGASRKRRRQQQQSDVAGEPPLCGALLGDFALQGVEFYLNDSGTRYFAALCVVCLLYTSDAADE